MWRLVIAARHRAGDADRIAALQDAVTNPASAWQSRAIAAPALRCRSSISTNWLEDGADRRYSFGDDDGRR